VKNVSQLISEIALLFFEPFQADIFLHYMF